MGARHKFNHLHLTGDILIAGFVGLLMQSWPLFLSILVALLGLDLYAHKIRFRSISHDGRSERRRGRNHEKRGEAS